MGCYLTAPITFHWTYSGSTRSRWVHSKYLQPDTQGSCWSGSMLCSLTFHSLNWKPSSPARLILCSSKGHIYQHQCQPFPDAISFSFPFASSDMVMVQPIPLIFFLKHKLVAIFHLLWHLSSLCFELSTVRKGHRSHQHVLPHST
jgi:hypothetical protein